MGAKRCARGLMSLSPHHASPRGQVKGMVRARGPWLSMVILIWVHAAFATGNASPRTSNQPLDRA